MELISENNVLCDFGCGQQAKFVLKLGKKCCSMYCQSCPKIKEKNGLSKKGRPKVWTNGHPRGMAGKKAWNCGITYVEAFGEEKSAMLKEKLSLAHIGKSSGCANTLEKEQLRRSKISLAAKLSGRGGYIRGSGRGKQGRYKGIWCDSSWELAWVIFSIDHGIQFERNKDRFSYEWNGKNHQYLPDFKLPSGQYIEVKGWINEQVKAKIASCPNLIVLVKSDMEPIIQYAIATYGKTFIDLYDNVAIGKRVCSDCGIEITAKSKTGRCVKCANKHTTQNRRNNERNEHCTCKICGKTISNKTLSKLCVACSKIGVLRKVVRPPIEFLITEVERIGYSAVGRQFGVSDNSVRKWIKIAKKNSVNSTTRSLGVMAATTG